MNFHVSDRGRRAAELWQAACALFNLLQIDLSGYPQGSVITKNSRQRRKLKSGDVKWYTYHYENIDVKGVGQFHLPVKMKGISVDGGLWETRHKILYRNSTENRIRYLDSQIQDLIRNVNYSQSSTAAQVTYDSIMGLAGQAMRCRGMYDICRKRARKQLLESDKWKNFFDESMLRCTTNLGEPVRSKNECLFANKLTELGIPYVYEMILRNEVSPDFTVFINDRVIFIELLGMMDGDDYPQHLEDKIVKYYSLNIIPGKNLMLINMTGRIDMRCLEELILGLFGGAIPDKIVPAAAA